MTDTAAIAAPPVTPIVITQYEKLRADIAIAAEENKAKTFNYRDPKENKAARSYLYRLRILKGDVDRARKEAKAHALELGRRVDIAAKELEGQVEALIAPHQKAIEDLEAEEVARQAKHRAVIARIVGARDRTSLNEPSAIAAELDAVRALFLDDLEEFADQAATEQAATIAHLEQAHAAAVKRVEEAAELARLRAEQANRAAAEKAEREKAEAERRRQAEEAAARERAEAAEKAAKDRAEQEAREAVAAAERREKEAQAAAERAEAERAAAIRRAQEAEARERAEQDRRAKEAADAQARQEARAKAEAENRAAMVDQIAADLAELKKAGAMPTMKALAELIVGGRLRHVRVEWSG